MFDSYVVTLFHRLYSKAKIYYSESYLKKLQIKIEKKFDIAFKNSVIVKTISKQTKHENIKTYKLYDKGVKKIDKASGLSRRKFKECSKSSYTVNLINKLCDSKEATLKTILLFILSFGISVGRRVDMVTLMFLILVILALFNSKKIIASLKNSFFIKIVKCVFTIDEEDISWK